MKIEEMVLPGDYLNAVKRLSFCSYALLRASEALNAGEITKGDIWLNEYMKSRDELQKYLENKQEHDKLCNLVKEMQHRGINIDFIKRVIN